MTSTLAVPDGRIEAVREFNRFYTRRIGVLNEGLLESSFSLTQSRLLWELAHVSDTTATELSGKLGLDTGYLSRLLRGFKERGFIRTARSQEDGRQVRVSLTGAGRKAFSPLDARSQEEVRTLLAALPEPEQVSLVHSLELVRGLLDGSSGRASRTAYLMRAHRAGDLGWVVARHGALYAQEYGWDLTFEALVARITADFVERLDASRERCWIAECSGVNVGCVFLVQSRDEATQGPIPGVAQLRLLLVEPAARGMGIGARLIEECTRFARLAGYERIRLWTNSILTTARSLYEKAGYRMVEHEPHHSFGHDLVGEIWELPLS
jgi:DNA-binding MarR family transcriptional regulator/GNAT superfamily N-acetyltransferase